MHRQGPILLPGFPHQLQGDFPAEQGAQVAHAVIVQGLAPVIAQVVFVQVQLRAVHEVDAGIQDLPLLFMELAFKFPGHGGLDPHRGIYFCGGSHGPDYAVRGV